MVTQHGHRVRVERLGHCVRVCLDDADVTLTRSEARYVAFEMACCADDERGSG
jgi:hypothetical protein